MVSLVPDVPCCVPEFPNQGGYPYLTRGFGSKQLEVEVLNFLPVIRHQIHSGLEPTTLLGF